jgi:ribulose-bisphosphate carboxylase large chain
MEDCGEPRALIAQNKTMPNDRIIAEYLIESPLPLAAAADVFAGEQSTGTFTQIPGETDELRERFAARLESVVELDPVKTPSLPGAIPSKNPGGVYQRGRVRVSFPLENTGPNLGAIVSTVAGNSFELRQLSGLRLLDLEFPQALVDHFPGPQFGVAGTRQLTGVFDRPIIGTIVKPSVGLTPEQTAELVRTLGMAGIDFVKDDELMANPPHSPLRDRVRAVMHAVNEVADATGRKVMYAFNITDQLDRMLEHHDEIVAAGGNCVMVSINSVGLAGVEFLRRACQAPIHGHRNGWGMITRCPALGMDFLAYQKLWRLAGVDQLHVNGLRTSSMKPTSRSSARSKRARSRYLATKRLCPSSHRASGAARRRTLTGRRARSTSCTWQEAASWGILAGPWRALLRSARPGRPQHPTLTLMSMPRSTANFESHSHSMTS